MILLVAGNICVNAGMLASFSLAKNQSQCPKPVHSPHISIFVAVCRGWMHIASCRRSGASLAAASYNDEDAVASHPVIMAAITTCHTRTLQVDPSTPPLLYCTLLGAVYRDHIVWVFCSGVYVGSSSPADDAGEGFPRHVTAM